MILLQKEVDKSLLSQGMSIPSAYHRIFCEKIGMCPQHGEKFKLKILLDGILYEVELINQNFDQRVYPNHPDVLQIRYSGRSGLPQALQVKFPKTTSLVREFQANPNNSRRQLSIPDTDKEYLILYATPQKGVLLAETISNDEFVAETKEIVKIPEMDYELAIDKNATILIETGFKKVRRLSRAIGNSLKSLYRYRCQICGQAIGEPYGSQLIHAHHIVPFTQSLNNDAKNIMVVCPNHHSIIHDRNPRFDWAARMFEYPNGFREGLKVNQHL